MEFQRPPKAMNPRMNCGILKIARVVPTAATLILGQIRMGVSLNGP